MFSAEDFKGSEIMKWQYRAIALFTTVCLILLPVFAQQAGSTPSHSIAPASQIVAQSEDDLTPGKRQYEAGRFAAAVELWQQAIASLSGQPARQAIAYNYLAIAHQDLGQWQPARAAIDQSLRLQSQVNDRLLAAQTLNVQGTLELNLGNLQRALDLWQQSESIYRALDDLEGIAISQINQAQALQFLGRYQRAQVTLEQLQQTWSNAPNSLIKVRGLRSLGATLRAVGDFDRSHQSLQESLAIAQMLNAQSDVAATLFQLANTARARNRWAEAIALYTQARTRAVTQQVQIEAGLNQLNLLIKLQQIPQAQALLAELQPQVINLPPSRWSLDAQVNLVEQLQALRPDSAEPFALLTEALVQAKVLKDSRTTSYVLGELGHFYERQKNWTEAWQWTEKAIATSQTIAADDMTVSWLWQQGRILTAQGQVEAAIAIYDKTLALLKSLRQDLVAMDTDVQFSFRDQVEPVYRQYVSLLLKSVDQLPQVQQQERLERSRQTIEALQIAELQNFFREACATKKGEATLEPQTALLYSIVLEDRLEIILSLSGQPLQHYGVNLARTEMSDAIDELRRSLNLAFLPEEGLPAAQKLYDWLIRPALPALDRAQTKTLVFVLDDLLQSIPVATLHDGQKYLIEKYSLSLTPALELFNRASTSAQSIHSSPRRALVAGLSEARQGFSPLPGVDQELDAIAPQFRGKVLLNQDFTLKNVQSQLENRIPTVVHLATHGQFSSNPEETFILTWDGRIRVKTFTEWFQQRSDRPPVELLILSACQTAKGDDRATLGLAGVAFRSGARSTLATLWSVQDDSTAILMKSFYEQFLQQGEKKAIALQKAQITLLKNPEYRHPYYWAAFVLIG
jgi:CHAT domain-containing protein